MGKTKLARYVITGGMAFGAIAGVIVLTMIVRALHG